MSPNTPAELVIERGYSKLKEAVGKADRLCNHPSRGIGITAYLENGGNIVEAQQMAALANIKTTQICDRTSD